MPTPALLALAAALPAPVQSPRIEYTLTHVPSESGPTWEVALEARGLARDVTPVLRLEDWGEWTEAEGYAELLESDPPAVGEGPSWHLADPDAWRGRWSARLRLRTLALGGEEHARHGLLPIASETYTVGFGWNVLPNLEGDGEPLEARRRLTLRAPEGVDIVTGWGGRASDGEQTVELERRQGNALIAFGQPIDVERSAAVEVFQFGAAFPIAAAVHAQVAPLVPAMAAACNHPAARPMIVFVTDTGGGGTGTDHGLRLGWTTTTDGDYVGSPYYRQFVAHELFHHWLGGALRPGDSSLVWFQEGFTDYFALWHLAASGAISRAWFVERLGELDAEARAASSLGSISFAQPGTRWRDGDGPNETMAYKGGAVLALALDAELSAQGRPGLHALLRHLLERGATYDVDTIRAWLRANGLAALDERAVAGTEVPSVHVSLQRAGFVFEERPVVLTYTGLATDGEPFGTITAVAPDSPAAAAGLEPGDVVTGFCHTRGQRPAVGEGVTLEHRFGLTWFDPTRRDHRIWVNRDGEELELALEPALIEGGVTRRWNGAGEALDAFFGHE